MVDAATIIPSTENGVSAATQPGWPCSSTAFRKQSAELTTLQAQASGRRTRNSRQLPSSKPRNCRAISRPLGSEPSAAHVHLALG